MAQIDVTSSEYADEPREVYPNAQLQLVAAEIRYPFSPRLGGEEALTFFASKLADLLPIPEPIQQQTLILGAGVAPDIKGQSSFRLFARDRTTAATVSPTSFLLETTDYERYGSFRRILSQLLGALAEFGKPAGLERIGLRYIDEIRVPNVTSSAPSAWEPYMHEALIAAPKLASEALPGMDPAVWNGMLTFQSPEQTTLVVRYGSFDGYSVDPNGPLRVKRRTEPTAFFLFDIDSFWMMNEEIADFDVDYVVQTCDRLHRPISSVFERCITNRLRDEVLRKEP